MNTGSSSQKRRRTTYPLGGAKADIDFPPLESWNPLNDVATIVAETNDGRVLCTVSVDVLTARFEFDADRPLRAVEENRVALHAAARKLIDGGAIGEDGRVSITLKDLD